MLNWWEGIEKILLARHLLGTDLGIPSEPCSSKVRLIVLLSNRMTLGIHAPFYLDSIEILLKWHHRPKYWSKEVTRTLPRLPLYINLLHT